MDADVRAPVCEEYCPRNVYRSNGAVTRPTVYHRNLMKFHDRCSVNTLFGKLKRRRDDGKLPLSRVPGPYSPVWLLRQRRQRLLLSPYSTYPPQVRIVIVMGVPIKMVKGEWTFRASLVGRVFIWCLVAST